MVRMGKRQPIHSPASGQVSPRLLQPVPSPLRTQLTVLTMRTPPLVSPPRSLLPRGLKRNCRRSGARHPRLRARAIPFFPPPPCPKLRPLPGAQSRPNASSLPPPPPPRLHQLPPSPQKALSKRQRNPPNREKLISAKAPTPSPHPCPRQPAQPRPWSSLAPLAVSVLTPQRQPTPCPHQHRPRQLPPLRPPVNRLVSLSSAPSSARKGRWAAMNY